MDVDSEKRVLDFLDGGRYILENPHRLNTVMRNAEVLVLMYSVTSRSSFERVRPIYEMVKKSCELSKDIELFSACSRLPIPNTRYRSTIPAILVGNKTDMPTHREVSIEEGVMLAAELDCGFVEA